MKPKVTNLLSLALAGMLQFMPLLRSALPTLQSMGSPTGALILRWAAGGVALFGYHAISSASSISVSPSTATIGTPYAGTITFSSGYAGSVRAMSMSNTCLGSFSVVPGLTVSYSGGHTASLTGTPSGGLGTIPFTMTVFEGAGCGAGFNNTQSTSLIIQNSGGGPAAPTMLVAPQNAMAQVGSDVILSGGAGGNPAPQYYWKHGASFIAGATNNTLLIPAVQLTDAGVYTLVASNATSQAVSACYLSVIVTPGSNTAFVLNYTNYVVAGTALTMLSSITNVPNSTNTYSWGFGSGTNAPSPIPGATNSTLAFLASQTTPSKSGTYSIAFTSISGSTTIVNGQPVYDSFWAFGYLPVVTNQPSSASVNPGTNVTFSATLAGSTYSTVFLYQNQTNLVAQTNLAAFNPATATTTTNISLTLSNVTPANAGSYTFVVTNYWGSTTSSPAALTVTSPLSVSAPQGQTNYAGKIVTFNVTASGTAPFSYQWQKNSLNLSNGGNISGVTSNILTLAPAANTNNGTYRVVVTNTSGSVTSSVALLSVVAVPQSAIALGSNVTLSAAGGIVGSNYVVQVSTNVADSAAWVAIKTNVVPGNGSINFTDTNALSTGPRFYRVQFP